MKLPENIPETVKCQGKTYKILEKHKGTLFEVIIKNHLTDVRYMGYWYREVKK